MIHDAIALAREALVKPFEGYHKKRPDGSCEAYPDPGTGKEPWTIGWGSTGPGINQNTVWTAEQAQEALDKTLSSMTYGLLSYSPSLVHTTDARFAAVISFAYNCGLGNYRVSTLRKRIDSQDWEGACEEIVKWDKANGRKMPGLKRRREAEAALLK